MLSVSIVHENRLHILYAIQNSNIQMNECTFPVFTVKMWCYADNMGLDKSQIWFFLCDVLIRITFNQKLGQNMLWFTLHLTYAHGWRLIEITILGCGIQMCRIIPNQRMWFCVQFERDMSWLDQKKELVKKCLWF